MNIDEHWIKRLVSTTKADDIPLEYLISATVSFSNGAIEKFTPEQLPHVLCDMRDCVAQVSVEIDVLAFLESVNDEITWIYTDLHRSINKPPMPPGRHRSATSQ